MAKVTFKSEPEGATLYIDGCEYSERVIEFLNDCFSGSEVICDTETLHPYLTDKTVSKIWWCLSREQRYNLGTFIIKRIVNPSFPLYLLGNGKVIYCQTTQGNKGCAGPTDGWVRASSVQHALLRFCRMNLKEPEPIPEGMESYWKGKESLFDSYSCCYYRYWEKEAYCWVDLTRKEEYHLPCYVATVNDNFAICALQIGTDQWEFDSWIFFQHDQIIRPCSIQMPLNSIVRVGILHHWDARGESDSLPYAPCSIIKFDILIAEWFIDRELCRTYSPP